MKTIFKNSKIEVLFESVSAKGISINVTAINPVDGKTYTRSAGWISKTWYLHSYAKSPAYIFETAAEEYHENIFKIAESVLSEIKSQHEDFCENFEYNGEETIEVNGRVEPKYGRADSLRYAYRQFGENLELIRKEKESSEFKKIPKGQFNNNKRRVSR